MESILYIQFVNLKITYMNLENDRIFTNTFIDFETVLYTTMDARINLC